MPNPKLAKSEFQSQPSLETEQDPTLKEFSRPGAPRRGFLRLKRLVKNAEKKPARNEPAFERSDFYRAQSKTKDSISEKGLL